MSLKNCFLWSLALITLATTTARADDTTIVVGQTMFAKKNIIENAVNSAGHTTLVAAMNASSGKGATGDVVWSNSKQEGFLLFKGLAKNDPNVNQYQLWIIDGSQKHPIDGGVFEINNSTTGDVIIPIRTQLHVVAPQAFAVTVEKKAGGVVVSDQDRIALLAKAGD